VTFRRGSASGRSGSNERDGGGSTRAFAAADCEGTGCPLPNVRPQESEAPGLLRITPMEKRDGSRESPREREVRGEIDPYGDWTPWSQYWAPGIELER
jgi:hypothetical protein